MSMTTDVAVRWPALVFGLTFVLAGTMMFWKPALFAQWQSDFWRKRYGIVAGPVGAGTKLFYRFQGSCIAVIGFVVAGNTVFN
jgi:hypothetical protein